MKNKKMKIQIASNYNLIMLSVIEYLGQLSRATIERAERARANRRADKNENQNKNRNEKSSPQSKQRRSPCLFSPRFSLRLCGKNLL
ncbi:hypothetical protein EJG51_004955 [Undibacterium piscinae]|jgi:hypothetical protein|uniref:Uncharacterized protein n=1 Tax=Undibacterium piscinae TaxID=2495591 RepID=A0A6M4A2B3_9BURK|nr:hypothetical protein EJG51_004955 [Undibacterium piscinae]